MPAARPTSDSRRLLLEVLGPVVAANGFDLEDVSVQVAGRRSVVRLVVDADDGVDLDDVARVSRAVSDVMDGPRTDELFGDAYTLEVSSPGIDRPLTEPRHWRRNTGRLVTVPAGGAVLTGRITTTDENGITFDIDGILREIGWADLGPGRVQVEFNRRLDTAEVDIDGDTEDSDAEDDDETAEG